MNLYKYDTHVHTKEGSACASVTGKEQVKIYKKLGYSGIIITDHFFNGNSNVPRKLHWKERVDGLAQGYESALVEGKKLGLSVFFGWEETYYGRDFLIYGLDKQWLYEHPEKLSWDIKTLYQETKKAGGFMVHAHPYRSLEAINGDLPMCPEYIDGVEVLNASNKRTESNQMAFRYAEEMKKFVTAGSDAHHKVTPRSGLISETPIKNIQEFIEQLTQGKLEIIMPEKK
jgi:predicted metal-dependent phosphoesterase TrpH